MHQRTVRLIKEIRCQRMRLKLDTLSTGLKKKYGCSKAIYHVVGHSTQLGAPERFSHNKS
jgi:hypothetical protein